MLMWCGSDPLAPCTYRKQSSDDRPPCLENPRPAGAESTLTENVASPFQAEPTHNLHIVAESCPSRLIPERHAKRAGTSRFREWFFGVDNRLGNRVAFGSDSLTVNPDVDRRE